VGSYEVIDRGQTPGSGLIRPESGVPEAARLSRIFIRIQFSGATDALLPIVALSQLHAGSVARG
jgi:hypothetical protein